MFLNAETPSMIPGFVREINHAFLWEGIRNGKHAVPAQAPQPASEASAAESSQQAAPQQPAEAEVPREYKSALAKAKN